MELLNKNDENSFDPTPKLKSSPIPITFVSFNCNDDKCIYCGEKYSEALFSSQRFCKKCLSRYITDTTDNDKYLDVYFRMKLECNKHEIGRTKEPQNIQECCANCLEILLFKQIPVYLIYNRLPVYTSIYNNVIESEKYCNLCKSLYQGTDQKEIYSFKLCSGCYRISFGWIESTLTKKLIPIIYLPWWENSSNCIACRSKLNLKSDCQKYCTYCLIFHIGCRYCLTTNVIFGPTKQSQCKKCNIITLILGISCISSGNCYLDDFLLNSRFDIKNPGINKFADKIKNLGNYFKPCEIVSSIYPNYKKPENIMKLIPYFLFTNVKKIAEGGFGIIYRATWINRTVILKKCKNSQDISKDFLNELKSIQHCYKINHHIIEAYGVTRDPDSGDYMLVMQYASEGDLHKYLQKDFINISWNKQKLHMLWQISKGLETIHKADFIHRDFHSGNILSVGHRIDYINRNHNWKIGDLGLSQPANNTSSNNDIYGVIPYIAPEIFKGTAFSKESDVYCMGMIMWELTTGCKPFANVEHDIHLILKILDGERPKITEDTPDCYADLMKSCWDPDPKKRPSIRKIRNTFGSWFHRNNNTAKQFNQAEIKRKELINLKKLGPEFAEKPNPNAIYTSRPLNYTSVELALDISFSSSPNSNSMIQNSSTIWHPNANYNRSSNTLATVATSPKKRNIEESNIETHNNNDYTSVELALDISFSSSPNSDSMIQNSSTIWHINANYNSSSNTLATVATSLKKRNIEESNIETHNNNDTYRD
ncbi:kinase-like domain-containing protein [Glomus cerebriforme]|uniref:Kinase-like domain-containing protein n=1 Tax=Glomus cerebriforme TaxID=658196 RepID=A0A397S5B1_9GLOM|nr:kinase-like domain-containing protein [Glomus cerebriforme]